MREVTKRFLVTGGAGFIGSAVARSLINQSEHEVLVLDKLTYAGSLQSLAGVSSSPRYSFACADIADKTEVYSIIARFSPDVIMNLAAESHVDRSIDAPDSFIQTNVVGTYVLLHAALNHWRALPKDRKEFFRFHQISTDEVFGSLGPTGQFQESSSYQPTSPYSASKASSDHLARAWHQTYGLPVIVTNCSNNYGPYQFPEKLIPVTIINALKGKPIPVYGSGHNVRDWLHVDDHVTALLKVVETGKPGSSYNIGARNERTNIEVVKAICRLIDELKADSLVSRREDLITHVMDRPGHDVRYAIDSTKIERELGWSPKYTFEVGLRETVNWYLENENWWIHVREGGDQSEQRRLASLD
jgi:dTDP-glucose 4,6-dehydratase